MKFVLADAKLIIVLYLLNIPDKVKSLETIDTSIGNGK